jgi:hypothetical protein
MLTLFAYIIFAYGIVNMIIFARGPFGVFEWWRNTAHHISDGFGELFTCPMCLSTWIGLLFSAINIWVTPNIAFTPFNMVFGTGNYIPFVLIMDMGFTSGIVWLIHQFEEMMERIGVIEEYVEEEQITPDIEDDNGEYRN